VTLIDVAPNSLKVISGKLLNADLCAAWRTIRAANPQLDSPYFHPEFTLAVAAVREDVRVAVIEQGGEPVAFFPHQRQAGGRGRPVGGRLSDFHGLVAAPDFRIDPAELLRACGLKRFAFSHLTGPSLPNDAGPRAIQHRSPHLDLSGGFERYCATVPDGSDFRQAPRKRRKLAREVGPVEFRLCTGTDEVLATLLQWKSAQYQKTGLTDVFSFPWTRRLVEHLATRGCDLCGCITSLYAGERLVAAHFGLRADGVFHYWFPAYDPAFARYSPGFLLLLEAARNADLLQIRRIDLGAGDERYKWAFANGSTTVHEGVIHSTRFRAAMANASRSVSGWVKDSPLGSPARQAATLIRPLRDRAQFH
jgi:CelD/BcsL family acetyltransferase involved in cellulose biosynthesis